MNKFLGQADAKNELNTKNNKNSKQGDTAKLIGSGYKTSENPSRGNIKPTIEKNKKLGLVPE